MHACAGSARASQGKDLRSCPSSERGRRGGGPPHPPGERCSQNRGRRASLRSAGGTKRDAAAARHEVVAE